MTNYVSRKSLLVLLVSVGVAGVATVAAAQSPSATETKTTTDSQAAAQELQQNQAAVTAKKEEIAAIEKKIAELKATKTTLAAEEDIIASQLEELQSHQRKIELELEKTQLVIAEVAQEQEQTTEEVSDIEAEVAAQRQQLKQLIIKLYEQEQQSVIRIFLTSGSFGQAMAARATYQQLQAETAALIASLQAKQAELGERISELEQQEADLAQLEVLQSQQEQELNQEKQKQQQFLSANQSEQAAYEHKIAEAEAARREIEQSVFTLQDAGVTLKLDDAEDMARYAGELTGVRPALLLGVLKIESNLGNNIGSGVFPDDMQPASREPFLRITKKLGLDPYTAPISARPRSGRGWGGAMGPAQIMPQTWEGIEPRLATLLNKSQPDPYEMTDAFVATALFLADRGATSRDGEYEAVNRYLAGPNWQRFTWYGDRVFAVAKEYEKEGL